LGAGGRGWGFRAVGACEIFWIMWILHLSRYFFFPFKLLFWEISYISSLVQRKLSFRIWIYLGNHVGT
jgi:hypothetical protein